ncbi:MAG: rod-binding protein [Deferrisomatales bacterium]
MNLLTPATAKTWTEPLPRDLEGACRALEKEFAQTLFRTMRQAMVPRSSAGSTGFARDTAESMLDGQWAELASQGQGLGLWRSLMNQLEPEVKSPVAAADEGIRDVGARTEAPRDQLRPHRRSHGAPNLPRTGGGAADPGDR